VCTTNNIIEYEGHILGLNKAKALGAWRLLAKIDSQVVAGHVEKDYIAREPELIKYLLTIRAFEQRFQGFTIKYIPRAENSEADKLAKATSNNLPIPNNTTFYQELTIPYKKWAHIPKKRESYLLPTTKLYCVSVFVLVDSKVWTFVARTFGPTPCSFQAIANCSPPLPSHFCVDYRNRSPQFAPVCHSSHIPFKVYLEEILYLTCVFGGYWMVRISCLIYIEELRYLFVLLDRKHSWGVV
jgi:hypothetical protein